MNQQAQASQKSLEAARAVKMIRSYADSTIFSFVDIKVSAVEIGPDFEISEYETPLIDNDDPDRLSEFCNVHVFDGRKNTHYDLKSNTVRRKKYGRIERNFRAWNWSAFKDIPPHAIVLIDKISTGFPYDNGPGGLSRTISLHRVKRNFYNSALDEKDIYDLLENVQRESCKQLPKRNERTLSQRVLPGLLALATFYCGLVSIAFEMSIAIQAIILALFAFFAAITIKNNLPWKIR